MSDKLNPYYITGLTFLFSLLAEAASGIWWFRIFRLISFAPAVYELVKRYLKEQDSEKVTVLLEAAGLTKKLGENVLKPHQIWRQETETGYRVGFSLPKGLSSEDFRKREQAISEALGADVRFSYERRGQVMMEVNHTVLKDHYKYSPVEYSQPVEIPAGYSRSGLQSIVFSDRVSSLLLGSMSGWGKSSFLRMVITNLILNHKGDPRLLKLHLVDFKFGAEFGIFHNSSMVQTFADDFEPTAALVSYLEDMAKNGISSLKTMVFLRLRNTTRLQSHWITTL